MPFFKFHLVDADDMAKVSGEMTERLRKAMDCPVEHIVLELMDSVRFRGESCSSRSEWPFVEVDYFERPKETEQQVAEIVSDCLGKAGYLHSDVYFRYLQAANYYEDGKCLDEGFRPKKIGIM